MAPELAVFALSRAASTPSPDTRLEDTWVVVSVATCQGRSREVPHRSTDRTRAHLDLSFGQCTTKRSAMGYSSFPVSESEQTRQKLSTKMMRERAIPRTRRANAT